MTENIFLGGTERHENTHFIAAILDIDGDDEGNDEYGSNDDDEEHDSGEVSDTFNGASHLFVSGNINIEGEFVISEIWVFGVGLLNEGVFMFGAGEEEFDVADAVAIVYVIFFE